MCQTIGCLNGGVGGGCLIAFVARLSSGMLLSCAHKEVPGCSAAVPGPEVGTGNIRGQLKDAPLSWGQLVIYVR